MPAPQRIKDLVKKFRANIAHYQSDKYTEEDVRHDFLNPLFAALGWDMDDSTGRGAHRDVRYETRVGTKAPDIQFYLEDKLRFFVEAKNPSINVCADPKAALQLRTYGWSAKLPLSILTDFEEFSIYDTSVRPKASDSARIARLHCIKFAELDEKWDEISVLFSREAVLAGKLDSLVKKRTKDAVDDGLLEDISKWREILAKDIAKHHSDFSEEKINHGVQDTLDRIIFLRICEDRGIEAEETLMKAVAEPGAYSRLFKIFKNANSRYDSGLFEAADMEDLKVTDETLKTIVSELYFPKSPYKFDAIPTEILGQVYEQFLGQVIRKTESGRVKVEEKPEVRKAGGVYYTPKSIVDYIVRNTVGKLVEGKTPKDVKDLTIVDPACGSGSFLIGAYEFLMDWYRDWYVANNLTKHIKEGKIFEKENGRYLLKLPERNRILTTHIFGVDIDRQAVEVAKLSLMLKALEGETQVDPFNTRILPHLDQNIKCGNALIGTDYFAGQPQVETHERIRVNTFDWDGKDGFPEIMGRAGFDVIIGNPPWGADLSEPDREYIERKYTVTFGHAVDTYALFLERALLLLKDGGLLSFITPDTYLRKEDYQGLRSLLLTKNTLLELVETGPVFTKVRDTWCAVILVEKKAPDAKHLIRQRKLSRFIVSADDRLENFGHNKWDSEQMFPQTLWIQQPGHIVGYHALAEAQKLIRKIERLPRLGDEQSGFTISRGEEGSKRNIIADPQGDFFIVLPDHVEKYHVGDGIKFSKRKLTETKVNKYYSHQKIWIIRIQKMRWRQRIVAAFDGRKNSAAMKTLQLVVSDQDDESRLEFLATLLVSKLVNFWSINYLSDDMNQSYLEQIPIPAFPEGNAGQDILGLSRTMRSLSKQVHASQIESEKIALQRQIDATELQIDQLVYKLYDLTKEEVRTVEEATK